MSFEPNNYTAIPNLVFDYWMEKLSPPEFKILCTLCRKIFGWHKTSDAVSIRQICKVTNLARSTVIKALKSLEDHRLLVVSRKEWQGCQYINQYSLNIEKPLDPKYTDPEDFLDDPNFDPTPTNNGGGPRNEPGVVRETDQGVVRETDPQKKDYTKERLTKDMSPNQNYGVGAVSPVSILAAQEFTSFQLIQVNPSDLHDRNLRIDDQIFTLGPSVDRAGMALTNFGPTESTDNAHSEFDRIISIGRVIV